MIFIVDLSFRSCVVLDNSGAQSGCGGGILGEYEICSGLCVRLKIANAGRAARGNRGTDVGAVQGPGVLQ